MLETYITKQICNLKICASLRKYTIKIRVIPGMLSEGTGLWFCETFLFSIYPLSPIGCICQWMDNTKHTDVDPYSHCNLATRSSNIYWPKIQRKNDNSIYFPQREALTPKINSEEMTAWNMTMYLHTVARMRDNVMRKTGNQKYRVY